MSQYEVKLQDGKTMRIGWDRPMNTFFAQVERPYRTISVEARNAIYEATSWDTSRDAYGEAVKREEDALNNDAVILWLGGKFETAGEFIFSKNYSNKSS